ncbi:penicillin-binding protein 1A [Pasteurella skyensis]|uniref:Penicillin-binding protein 1A n=1 Tax=Phocoenobacter skyensis TaxID=97481 RepID=A0AAJ6N8I9_9PAST|nr:penicillin-binding protein 1A [Pasteurella skyensis]MDP8162030.1 penicillin-binding protein 1A [Pasteurella skyensis]MDP8172186.1 penicillin-binding protein 1A [Pasteurella skyensis]MDP8176466.1 penicillin-binding protein 1A [Pasteurella skyensis]MDP8178354.1 penicillin-binding protein 1A [Pasteurella skyensis]MDP8182890.1 penicillin-binding protein 1A [Pasteurella skyensis]
MKITKIILSTLLSLIIFSAIGAGILYVHLKSDLPDVSSLKNIELQQPMQIYTADGKLIGEVGEERRIPVKLSDVPQPLIDAFIATEDTRFYEHNGYDLKGIARAAYSYIKGGSKQGASTITQQLARNIFLTPERRLIRKLRELILATEIEKVMTKDEILELYLNKIYLGYRSYGIATAAQTYFGKDLDQLSLSEMAMIAGLPKAPSTMNPIYSIKRATNRRNTVLWRMLQVKKITQEQYEKAKLEPIVSKFHKTTLDFRAEYVTEMVRKEMVKRYGEEVAYTKGFKVFSTVLSKDQFEAQKALRENLIRYDRRHGWRGATTLWEAKDKAWNEEDIIDHLSKLPLSEPFTSAAVLNVAKDKAHLLLADGEEVDLFLSGMKWARKFINKNAKGKQPKSVQDVLKVGQQIWVRNIKNKQGEMEWELGQIPQMNSALVSLDSHNGAIEAAVGGFSFAQSNFNRVTQSMVQVGSSIKPFIYTAAMNKGLSLATTLNDAPITIRKAGQEPWQPKNSPNIYEGKLRLRVGLGKSKNVMMVRTVKMAGIDYIADYLQRFGFNREQYKATEALALGAASFTPLEMARGYAVFDNGGYLIDPFIISRIEDADGNELYKANPRIACISCNDIPVLYAEPTYFDFVEEEEEDENVTSDNISSDTPDLHIQASIKKEDPSLMATSSETDQTTRYAPRVISGELAFLMRSALHSAAFGEKGQDWRGTSWRIAQQLPRQDIGGKTGTTNNSKVAWYAGFGSNIVTTVYVSSDDSKELGRGESGAKTALPAWIQYMKVALSDKPQQTEIIPPNIIKVGIDAQYGLLGEDLTEYFIKGTEPKNKYIIEQGYQIPITDPNRQSGSGTGTPTKELF